MAAVSLRFVDAGGAAAAGAVTVGSGDATVASPASTVGVAGGGVVAVVAPRIAPSAVTADNMLGKTGLLWRRLRRN